MITYDKPLNINGGVFVHIGIAGTGKMGSAIAKRLLTLNHNVTVWNRSAERAAPLLELGASWAKSPLVLAQTSDMVISMLTDEAALEQVYLGVEGLLAQPLPHQLYIDMSTVRPEMPKLMGEHVAKSQASFLECPVGGSVGPAAEGKLLGFVGGEVASLERARPILEQLCRRVEHVGPLGAGATMKLAINLPLMVYWQTLGEALSLIQPLGLDPKRVIEIFSETSGGPNMLKVRGGMIAQALGGENTKQITVDIATMRKDVRSMLAQAQATKVQLPLTSATLKSFDEAAAKGLDSADCTQLLVWWLSEGSHR
jgi:3-hydroxyisobutyrate dehydrogenase